MSAPSRSQLNKRLVEELCGADGAEGTFDPTQAAPPHLHQEPRRGRVQKQQSGDNLDQQQGDVLQGLQDSSSPEVQVQLNSPPSWC